MSSKGVLLFVIYCFVVLLIAMLVDAVVAQEILPVSGGDLVYPNSVYLPFI